ncbi:MAG: putative toxin-antitoxin system toxin component, PIN family [Nitrococcus sp.]|nr:putative toxin-antitoxin system toxin component, PIN family [Nitrococcus sp.]
MRADRCVIDSNVLIGALLSPTGKPRYVLDQLARDGSTLLFSNATFAELTVRQAKPKFDPYRTIEQMESFLDWLVELGEWVEPALHVDACRDSDDNKFLALALSGEADYLITGDADLLALDPFDGLPILKPAVFLAGRAGGE